MNERQLFNPTTTWIPLATAVATFIAVAGFGASLSWRAATFAVKLDAVAESTKDVTQMREDIAVIKAELRQQSSLLSGLEKKISDLDGKYSALTLSLEDVQSPDSSRPKTTVRPAWYYSIPSGWTLGSDGKLRKL